MVTVLSSKKHQFPVKANRKPVFSVKYTDDLSGQFDFQFTMAQLHIERSRTVCFEEMSRETVTLTKAKGSLKRLGESCKVPPD